MRGVPDTASGSTAPAIEGIKLSKAFGGVQALDSASFAARRGISR